MLYGHVEAALHTASCSYIVFVNNRHKAGEVCLWFSSICGCARFLLGVFRGSIIVFMLDNAGERNFLKWQHGKAQYNDRHHLEKME